MTPNETESLVGSTIAGRYHLVRQLGDGGVGTVFKAADQVLRRFVAVKLLHRSTAANAATVERFVREARSAAAIGHPNIIEVIDFGYDAGRPFLVLEYLKGQSLSQIIALEAPFRVDRACAIATHALAGLSAAHARGILHRDLKPANLMVISRLGDRDFVKVCDFGFATLLTPKRSIHDGRALTPARTLVGTPAYAAPERLRGDDRPDPRVDVYAIGVVLFEMLAGRRPFDAPTFAELAQKVRNDPPPRLSQVRRDTPSGLDDVLARALAKDRDARWPSAEVFAAALVPFGGKRVDTQQDDEDPSDVFTMDLLRLRRRETEHRHRLTTTGSVPTSRSSQGGATTTDSDSLDIHVSVEDPSSTARTTASDGRIQDAMRATLVDGMPPTFAAQEPTIDPSRSVRGAVMLEVLRFVEQKFGPRAVREVLQHVGPTASTVFQRGVGPTDEIPLALFERLVLTIDAKLGNDDMQLLASCGRAVGDLFVPMFREAPTPPTVETMLVDLPRVVARGFSGVGVRSRSIGRGYGTVEVLDAADHALSTCVTFLGVVDRSLNSGQARDLEVSCTTCRALGDAECLLHVSWFTA